MLLTTPTAKPTNPGERPSQARASSFEQRSALAAPRSPGPGLEFARQVGFIAAAVLLYFVVRGLTQGEVDVAVRNGLGVLAFEQRLGIDIEVWAQGLIVDHQWLVDMSNSIYIWGHWPVITITLVWLHRTRRTDFLLLRNAMFISGGIGLMIFATYAVAPPRLLDDSALLDTVTQHSNAYRILQPPALVNKYAAVPSLHVGWNLLIGIFLYRAGRGPTFRAFAIVSPLLMAIAVVVTANHYIIDGVLGSGLALVGLRISYLVTPRLMDFDAWFRQCWHHNRHRPARSLIDRPRCEVVAIDRRPVIQSIAHRKSLIQR